MNNVEPIVFTKTKLIPKSKFLETYKEDPEETIGWLLEFATNNLEYIPNKVRNYKLFDEAFGKYYTILDGKNRNKLEEKFGDEGFEKLYICIKDNLFNTSGAFTNIRSLVNTKRITVTDAEFILSRIYLIKKHGSNSDKDKIPGSIPYTNLTHLLDIIKNNRSVDAIKLLNAFSVNDVKYCLPSDWVGHPEVKRILSNIYFTNNLYSQLKFIRDTRSFLDREYGDYAKESLRDFIRYIRVSSEELITINKNLESYYTTKHSKVGRLESCCQIDECSSCINDSSSRRRPELHHWLMRGYWKNVPRVIELLDVTGNAVFLDINKHKNMCHEKLCYLCYNPTDDSVYIVIDDSYAENGELGRKHFLSYESQEHKIAQIEFIKNNGLRVDTGYVLPNKLYWSEPEEKWLA